jgi:hypothetical protein
MASSVGSLGGEMPERRLLDAMIAYIDPTGMSDLDFDFSIVRFREGVRLEIAPTKLKKTRIRHSDPPPGSLSATGTRWFNARNLKRLTDWPWGEAKTRRIFANMPGVLKDPHPKTLNTQQHNRRNIPEALAYKYLMEHS